MTRRQWLLLFIAGAPVIAFLIATGHLWKYKSDYERRIAPMMAEATPEQRREWSLDTICENPSPKVKGSCSTLHLLWLVQVVSVASAITGLAWLAAIGFLGSYTQNDRKLLLHVFRPGLYFTAAFLAALVIAHGFVIAASLHFLSGTIFGMSFSWLTGGVMVGAAAGLWIIIKAFLSVLRTEPEFVLGRPISAGEAPEMWSLVRTLSNDVGVDLPDRIIAGLEPTFYVTDSPLRTDSGKLTGRSLYLSLPLMRILSRNELASVIGHELGHYKGEDLEYSQRFFPIYRRASDAIAGLDAGLNYDFRAVAMLPALAILSEFIEAFATAERKCSRERELHADRVGAGVTDRTSAAVALVKVHAFVGCWFAVDQEIPKVLSEGKAFVNLSEMFAHVVKDNASPASFDALGECQLQHPTDTHPPLTSRLENLGIALDEVRVAALDVAPETPSSATIQGVEALERELTNLMQSLYVKLVGRPETPVQAPQA